MTSTRSGIQTDIREQLRTELAAAGDMTTFDPASYGDLPLNRLSIKIKQATKAETPLTTELRTIDGVIVVKRTSFPKMLPGMSVSTRDVLMSLVPWPDDPFFDMKRAAMFKSIDALGAVQ